MSSHPRSKWYNRGILQSLDSLSKTRSAVVDDRTDLPEVMVLAKCCPSTVPSAGVDWRAPMESVP
jgi:hypothetical protein